MGESGGQRLPGVGRQRRGETTTGARISAGHSQGSHGLMGHNGHDDTLEIQPAGRFELRKSVVTVVEAGKEQSKRLA